MSAAAVERVLTEVSAWFEVSRETLLERDRHKVPAMARQVAAYILRRDYRMSFPEIGDVLGKRDHTTIMKACDTVDARLERDDQTGREVRRSLAQVRQRVAKGSPDPDLAAEARVAVVEAELAVAMAEVAKRDAMLAQRDAQIAGLRARLERTLARVDEALAIEAAS